ncbi:MAG: hypothetical protein ACRDP1_00350 [Nocardioidaceae bacterium]
MQDLSREIAEARREYRAAEGEVGELALAVERGLPADGLFQAVLREHKARVRYHQALSAAPGH